MLCPNCGTEISSGSSGVCPQCGQSVETAGSGEPLRLFEAPAASRRFFFDDTPQEPEPEPQPEQPEPQPEQEPALEPEPEPWPEPPAQSQLGVVSEPQPEPTPGPEPEPEIALQSESELQPELQPEPMSEPGLQVDPAPDLQIEPEPETQPEPEPEPELQPEPEPQVEPELQPELQPQAMSELEPVPEPETQPASAVVQDAATVMHEEAATPEDAAPEAGQIDRLGEESAATQPDSGQGETAQAAQLEPVKSRRPGLVIAIVAVVVLVLGVVGFVCLQPGSPIRIPGITAVDKSGFTGEWELVEGNTSGLEAENLKMLHNVGLFVTLTLDENGTGMFKLFEKDSEVTWDAESATTGSLVLNDSRLNIELVNGELVAKGGGGDAMTFKPHDPTPAEPQVQFASSGSAASDAANASNEASDSSQESASATASSSTASESASASSRAAMQTVGNDTCGYLKIPASWEDRVDDYDAGVVEDTEMIYFCDPNSRYLSDTFGHYMFSRAVQMRFYEKPYDEIASQVLDSYSDENVYSDVSSTEMLYNGFDSFVITANVAKDNLNVRNVILDVDNNGGATVLLTLQGTPNDADAIESYAAGWSAGERWTPKA